MRTRPESFDPPAVGGPGRPGVTGFDPLHLCIYTTICLIAWLVTPPAAAMVFSAIALRGYGRARRAGLLSSRCLLGDTRLVLAYLAVVFVASTAVTVVTVAHALGR